MRTTATAAIAPPTARQFGRLRRYPLPPRRPLDDPAAGFADLFFGFRQRAGLSQAALGRRAGIDASYLDRVESGERRLPTPALLATLAPALRLDPAEADRLWWSSDAVPPTLRRLDDAAPTLLAVARLLSDRRLSPEARADFRACIEAIAHCWQGGAR